MDGDAYGQDTHVTDMPLLFHPLRDRRIQRRDDRREARAATERRECSPFDRIECCRLLADEGDRRTESNRRADTEQLLSVGIPVVGQPHEVVEAVHGHVVDTVVVAGQGLLSRHALRRLAWEFEGTGVEIFFAS